MVFLFGFAVGKGPPSPTHSLRPLEAACWSPQAEEPLPLSSALVSLSREARDPGAPAGSNTTEVAGKGDAEGSTAPYEGVLDASLELFKFTIGMGELAVQAQLRFRGVALLLLLTHVLLTYVLLLNMLVALMSETVSSVASDSWSIWKLQVPGDVPRPLQRSGPGRSAQNPLSWAPKWVRPSRGLPRPLLPAQG